MKNATRNAFVFLLVALVAVMGSTHEASSAFYPTPSGTGMRWVTSGKENAAARNYFEAGSSPHAATGLIRLPDEPVGADVMVGLSGGSDYRGIGYTAAGQTWTFGNTSQYNQQNGVDFRVSTSGGGSLYMGAYAYFTDAIAGRYADLNAMNLTLTGDFTTTLATATTLNTSFTCATAEVYELEWWGTVSNPSGGVKFSIVAPATSTVEGWLDAVTTTVTTLSRQRFTAINTLNATATNTGVSVAALNRIFARVICNDVGTVGIGSASVTAGQITTIRAGATLRAQRTVPL